jgi:hypothetical protein
VGVGWGGGTLLTENFNRNLRYIICTKTPCKWAALSIGALVGNLEEVRLLGLYRKKLNAYLGSFFLDPEDINP